jgi:hypothetical protein
MNIEEDNQINELYLVGKPVLIRWIIKYSSGYIRTENQAAKVLLAFVILFFLVSIFISINSSSSKKIDYSKNGYPKIPGLDQYQQTEPINNNQ